jgi:hypothetical protein
VVDEMPLGEWRDDDRWHPSCRAPSDRFLGRHVVPDATILGVGDDHRRGMIVATHHAGIARMLIVRANRLVEADRARRSLPGNY